MIAAIALGAIAAITTGAWLLTRLWDVPYERSFTAGSYWNTPLPEDAPAHPDGAAYLAWLEEHAPRGILLNGLAGNPWGMPTFITGDHEPIWSVELGHVAPQTQRLEAQGLHMPPDFGDTITGTSDSPAVIIDVSSGYEVHLSRVRQTGERAVEARAAAIYWLDGNGLVYDAAVNPDGDPRNFGHRGVPPSVMMVRDEQIRAGKIDNVLEVFVPGSAECNVRPMVGYEPDRGGVICQGSRLRIKPDVDLGTFGLTPDARVIAEALQRYGAVVGDTSGVAAAVIKMEQGHGQWSDLDIHVESLSTIPWSAFEFVDAGGPG